MKFINCYQTENNEIKKLFNIKINKEFGYTPLFCLNLDVNINSGHLYNISSKKLNELRDKGKDNTILLGLAEGIHADNHKSLSGDYAKLKTTEEKIEMYLFDTLLNKKVLMEKIDKSSDKQYYYLSKSQYFNSGDWITSMQNIQYLHTVPDKIIRKLEQEYHCAYFHMSKIQGNRNSVSINVDNILYSMCIKNEYIPLYIYSLLNGKTIDKKYFKFFCYKDLFKIGKKSSFPQWSLTLRKQLLPLLEGYDIQELDNWKGLYSEINPIVIPQFKTIKESKEFDRKIIEKVFA